MGIAVIGTGIVGFTSARDKFRSWIEWYGAEFRLSQNPRRPDGRQSAQNRRRGIGGPAAARIIYATIRKLYTPHQGVLFDVISFGKVKFFRYFSGQDMKVKFWGVRGSIPSPGPNTVRYGGNTTCIEVRTDDNELIIVDAGTGIFPLSQSLLGEMPLTANVLISHSHWDHIQGLPFFAPNFIPGNVLRLHGAFDPESGKGVEQVMSVQLQYSYFPVRESEMKARIEYVTLAAETSIQIGSATITPHLMNHPVINFAYRIEANGKSIFITGDHEPPQNIYEPGESEYAAYQNLVDSRNKVILRAMRGVDVLIADCSYTEQEYPEKRGWGHGTFSSSIQYAVDAGAKVLFCTHHEPTRSDAALEAAFQEVLTNHPPQPGGPTYRLAREGETYEF